MLISKAKRDGMRSAKTLAMKPNKLLLLGLGIALPALAARLARSAAGAGYSAITHEDPPKNPAHPLVKWNEAILWTVFSGAVGGLAQLVAQRWLAKTSVPAEGYDMKSRLRRALN